MGKLALIMALGLAGLAVFHGSASGDGLRESARQSSEQQRLAVARSAAKTGWARAKQGLVQDFVSDTLSGSTGQASYETRVVVTGGRALVTTIGRVPVPGRSTTTDFQIVYHLEAVGGDELPTFAEYAIAVDGDLDMSGNGAIVTPGVPGATGDSLNVQVHSNGNIHAGSGSTIVQGFGTYTTSSSGKISSTFRPRSNPDGDPVLAQADSVQIPAVVPSEILAAYGGATTVLPYDPTAFYGTKIQSQTLPGGTRDEPYVYYAPGRALLTNITFDGYAVLVAEGLIDLEATVSGTPESGRDETALSIFTPDAVKMSGGANAYASIFATGGLSYKGNVDIYGSLVIGGDFAHGGGAMVHYLPATASLFRPWSGGDPALKLLAYREM